MAQTIIDVATYILERTGTVTTMKLQKLAFYSQAQHLAQYGSSLFPEDFEAWRGGPVVPRALRTASRHVPNSSGRTTFRRFVYSHRC